MPQNFQIMPARKSDFQPDLLKSLHSMKTHWGISGLKLSTEDAAMSIDQINYWTKLCHDLLPVIVKIGGPNARNDIRQLVKLNISGFIAPMVESAFGLENYIEALRDYNSAIRFQLLEKHVNIETETAVKQLDSILDSPSIHYIDEITIGRKDLSRSMNRHVDDPEVQSALCQVIKKIRSKKINVSIGGGILPKTIDSIISTHSPDQFNTRILTFRVDSHQSYQKAVRSALEFEIKAIRSDASQGFISREEEKHRILELRKRLAR